MKLNFARIFISVLFLFIVSTVTVPCAFASEYVIYDAWWDDDWDGGSVKASWEPCEHRTTYTLSIYRRALNSKQDSIGKCILEDKRVSGKTLDVSVYVRDAGTGHYTFTIAPVKGNVSEDMRQSESMEVDSEFLSRIKNSHPKKKTVSGNSGKPASSAVRGWRQCPDGRWQFGKDDGKYAAGEWLTSGDRRYYFNSDGFMATGWACVDGFWYFFEQGKASERPEGSLLTSCVTPDGYTVNEEGKWTENGSAVQENSSLMKSDGTQVNTLSIVCSVKNSAGSVPDVTFDVSHTSEIAEVSYSPEYSEWNPGTTATAYLVIAAKEGYVFGSGTKYSVSNGSITENTGDSKRRNVKVTFKPSFKLVKPENFCYSEENGLLTWDKVKNASRYKIVIKESGETVVNEYVTKGSYDVADYFYNDDIEISIQACGAAGSSNVTNSSAVKLTPDEIPSVFGVFKIDNGRIFYLEYGEKVRNEWRQLLDHWYYFEKTGAACTSEFTDENGVVYRFDEKGHWIDE